MPRLITGANPFASLDIEVNLHDRPSRRGRRSKFEELAFKAAKGDQALTEQLAAANARGGPDNSALTERGIRGQFYEQLEIKSKNTWAIAAGLFFMSDAVTEKHRWLGQVPEPRRHYGGLNLNKLRDLGVDITNEDFETSIQFNKRDWRLDKTGHMSRRLPQLALAYSDHWNKLCVEIVENNPLAYDGVAFFSTAHSIGDSGTMDNALVAGTLDALNVTVPAVPTADECVRILSGMAAHFLSFADDQGRPANASAHEFVMVCPPKMAPGMVAAAKGALRNSGSSNPNLDLEWNFTIVPEQRLSAAADCFMFRVDDKSSPAFILQEEDTPTVEILGEGSQEWIYNNRAVATAKATRAAGPGDFKKAIKATLS